MTSWRWKGGCRPDPLDLLSRNKSAIVEQLSHPDVVVTPVLPFVEIWEERAGICEFDGDLSRDPAEQLAALVGMPTRLGISESQPAVVIDAAARFLDRIRKGRNMTGCRSSCVNFNHDSEPGILP